MNVNKRVGHLRYIGRILGAFAGVAFFPSFMTALVGFALGALFDFAAQKNRNHNADELIYQTLCLNFLSLAAALAALGRKPEMSWKALKPLLTGTAIDIRLAERHFHQALNHPQDIDTLAQVLHTRVAGSPHQLTMLLAGLFTMVHRQGATPTQKRLLESMANYFAVDLPDEVNPSTAHPHTEAPQAKDPHAREDNDAYLPHPHKSDALGGRNPYFVLGVEGAASASEIKAAYRQLVAKNHPDRLRGQGANARALAEAEEKMRVYNAAYDMLSKRHKG